ncbi:rhomboid family intramembrane serine protease [Fulvivirgaceae bacterium BMA12]|uniref:Rhomboid family intramembrane serine protease n=1 Tax=Agaribacillus aureus TaxID=3051825 RepID=A0ABT8LM25_9BACT|nr:rhomboid family intramembrane serine protease [Fulvivirgaceae bacterium BMA12]
MSGSIDKSFIVPTRFIFIMWAVFSVEFFLQIDLGVFGIYPRTFTGLIGILTAPLIHGNLGHIISNTFPMLFLGTTLYFLFDRIAQKVFLQCYFLTGILVWLFARSSYHIGASGLIYGLAAFLIFFGLFRGDLRSLLVSLLIFAIYNGIFYGVLPSHPNVSWESHLCGAIVGVYQAARFSKVRKVSS